MLTHVALGLVALIVPLIPTSPDTETPASLQNDTNRTTGAQPPEIRPQFAVPGARKKGDDDAQGPAGSPVPEPYTLALVGTGLLALALALHSRRRHLRAAQGEPPAVTGGPPAERRA